jgi:hypothetical protein
MRFLGRVAMVVLVGALAVPTPVQAGHTRRVTLVIGDSITYRSTPQLREIRPSFVIQGVPGSNANSLESRLQAYLDQHRAPDRVVVALGSNGFHTTESSYWRAVKLLPSSTVVGLVTAWRNPAIWGRARSMIVWHNTQFMFDVAHTRPNTCTIGWRRVVVANPRLLVDGLHPTVPRGERVWARTVVRGIRGCH